MSRNALIVVVIVIALGVAGYVIMEENNQGPFEEMGESIDDATDEISDSLEDTADRVSNSGL